MYFLVLQNSIIEHQMTEIYASTTVIPFIFALKV